MATLQIGEYIVLSHEHEEFHKKYWTQLSQNIMHDHGGDVIRDNDKVLNVLIDSFKFLIDRFSNIIKQETDYLFFRRVFFLHEESVNVNQKIMNGAQFPELDNYFARYRRVLKLILEQGCTIKLVTGKDSTENDRRFDRKIQELFYLGDWIYSFADCIAEQKMINGAHYINFNEDGMIGIHSHFAAALENLKHLLKHDGPIYDIEAGSDLLAAINENFCIDFQWSINIIHHIKSVHSKKTKHGNLQTLEPYILPINLLKQHPLSSKEKTEAFYNGLTFSRATKKSIEETVIKPYSNNRYFSRPILVYNIDNEERALIGEGALKESFHTIPTNGINWQIIPEEWRPYLNNFTNRKADCHAKLLENQIQEYIKANNLVYCRNIESFQQHDNNNINLKKEDSHKGSGKVGEIDFIIINQELQKIFVADAKYLRAKYDKVGWAMDYSKFLKYEEQIEKKLHWVNHNRLILQEHLEIENDLNNLDLTNYEIEGLFFINTPTFYMFNGEYKAIPLNKISDYITGKWSFPTIEIINEFGESFNCEHPYFRIPNN